MSTHFDDTLIGFGTQIQFLIVLSYDPKQILTHFIGLMRKQDHNVYSQIEYLVSLLRSQILIVLSNDAEAIFAH